MLIDSIQIKQILSKDNIPCDNHIFFDKYSMKKLHKALKSKKYCEIATYYYDLAEDQKDCNWIDIEGINYGWLWAKNILTRRFDFIQKWLLIRFIEKQCANKHCYTYSCDGIDYYFVYGGEEYYDMITISDTELQPF